MILTNENNQYLYGTRYKKKIFEKWIDGTHRKIYQGEKFKYELLVYPRKSYGQIVNNLIATQGRLTIKTNWNLDWKVNQFIVDNYGKKYIIQEIQTMPQEVNPQVLALAITNPDTDYVLSLIEIENAEELL